MLKDQKNITIVDRSHFFFAALNRFQKHLKQTLIHFTCEKINEEIQQINSNFTKLYFRINNSSIKCNFSFDTETIVHQQSTQNNGQRKKFFKKWFLLCCKRSLLFAVRASVTLKNRPVFNGSKFFLLLSETVCSRVEHSLFFDIVN